MDLPNAFAGKTLPPTPEELSSTLGSTTAIWNELVDLFTNNLDATTCEWNSTGPKYGWTLLLIHKKRRIVYLGPCAGCFRASFVLGDRAVAAARASNLPKPVLTLLNKAPHYAEGTGLRLAIKTAKDLPVIRKLAQIKLAN